MTRLTRLDASFEHVASTPIAVPTGEPGPLVTAPAGPVRGPCAGTGEAPRRPACAPWPARHACERARTCPNMKKL